MPPSLLRRPAPTPFFHPFFKFSDPHPPPGGNQNLLPLLKGAGGLSLQNFCLISVIIRKKAFSVVSSGLELEFHPPSLAVIYILYYIVLCKPMHHADLSGII